MILQNNKSFLSFAMNGSFKHYLHKDKTLQLLHHDLTEISSIKMSFIFLMQQYLGFTPHSLSIHTHTSTFYTAL